MDRIEQGVRISKEIEETLTQYVKAKFAQLPETEHEAAENKYYEEYVMKYPLVHSLNKAGKNPAVAQRLTYRSLPDFLQAAGMTYLEMFHVLAPDEKLDWHNEEERMVNECLERMTPESLYMITKAFERALGDDFRVILDTTGRSRSANVCTGISYVLPKNEGLSLAEKIGYVMQWKNGKGNVSFANINYNYLPAISNATGLPLHWLAGLGDGQAILSANGKVEHAMDMYMMLSDFNKVCFRNALEELA